MNTKLYDVIIIGAGPAGCSCAYMLRNSDLRIAIIDKDAFPRDKICGDALSADVINQMNLMDEGLANEFQLLDQKQPSHGVRFFAPNGRNLDIDFVNTKHSKAAGYICKRKDFDFFLFSKIKSQANVDVFKIPRSSTSTLENIIFQSTLTTTPSSQK